MGGAKISGHQPDSPPQCRQWRLWWRVARSDAAEQFLINGLCGRIRNNPAEKLHLIEKLLAGETNCLGGSQLKLSRGKYLLSAVKIFAARTIIESQDRGGSSEFLRGHGPDRTAADPEPRFSSASSANQNPSSSLCSLFTDLQFRKTKERFSQENFPPVLEISSLCLLPQIKF